MPELPEVESVRRSLVRARLAAAVVAAWRSRKPLRVGTERRAENLQSLLGCTPGAIERRGKYLIIHFVGVDRGVHGLLVHLGMSGHVELATREARPRPHTHLRLAFADGRELRFVDPRRFGALRAAPLAQLVCEPPLSRLGPEPLAPDFAGPVLAARAARSVRVLRDVLLDQSVVAGVGNIYALEALHLAELHPLMPARRLDAAGWDRLAAAVVTVLEAGLYDGGTTFRDFRNVGGEAGGHLERLAVYGRAGEPCRRCGRILRGFVHGGRSGVRCPACQKIRGGPRNTKPRK